MTALPKYIDLTKLEDGQQADYDWAGTIALADLPRVYALRDKTANANNRAELNVKLHFSKSNGVIWADIHSEGELWQTCQRCLEPVAVSLDYDNTLALLNDESQASLLEDEADYLVLSEFAPDGKLNPLPMLEDELLIQLPLSPKHTDCELAVTEVGDDVVQQEENPFAVLAGLKGQLGL